MSAFFVENTTIDRVLFWVRDVVVNDPSFRDGMTSRLSALGFDVLHSPWEDALGQAMLTLNARAVQQRYEHVNGSELEAFALGYLYTHQPTAPVQAYKSLKCWLYQCTEGDVPTTALYQFFDDYVERIMLKRFVQRLPSYDAAEWG